jgi:uncharacterized protein YecE (DUF72 family)
MIVHVGLCGFTVSMKTYADCFHVVEVQQTFYDPPPDAVMQKWLDATPNSLEYTMKVWQVVTHPAASPTYRRMKRALAPGAEPGFFRDSAAVRAGWQRSLECAEVLNATGLLFQCPASFRPEPENIARMRRFFARVKRPAARLLWEPRGKQWVEQRDLAIALCRDLDLIYVVDPFVTIPAARHPVYWRLHGINGARHSYTDAELRQLHGMLLEAQGEAPAYVLFNNLPRVGDAKRFIKILRENAPTRRSRSMVRRG